MNTEKMFAVIVVAGYIFGAIGIVADSYSKAEIAKANATIKVAELNSKCK